MRLIVRACDCACVRVRACVCVCVLWCTCGMSVVWCECSVVVVRYGDGACGVRVWVRAFVSCNVRVVCV